MAFTTQIFLFLYFPLAVAGIWVCRWLEKRSALLRRWQLENLALAGGSLIFYGWAIFDGIYRLLAYTLVVWAIGKLLSMLRERHYVLPLFREENGNILPFRWLPLELPALWAAVLILLATLVHFKYIDFVIRIWNSLFQAQIHAPSLVVPIGISFITFSAISYLVDIHRGLAPAGSYLDCLLYLSFFPKVISGPIVLWRDFRPQLSGRQVDLDDISLGLDRIMIGFFKKLVLADLLAVDGLADQISAWWAALLYMLQIYYDFAGYSDIAIGLGRLFGFHFQENFNFPYRSCSITEFWRRWHISLGAWFREYVYIPMGGSHRGKRRTLLNLTLVFALTGIWHGAGWNYVVWGGINAFFVVLERLIQDKAWYQKIPKALKWAGTMLVVLLFWQLFYFGSLSETLRWLKVMIGLTPYQHSTFNWRYFLKCRKVFLVIIGILGATVFGEERIQEALQQARENKLGLALWKAGLLVLFALSVLCMVNSVYRPFIYFQYN